MTQPWGPWPPNADPVIPPPGPAPYTPGLPDLWNPPPTNTTEALDQLVTRACTDLFLDTTSGASGNVYITWAALWDVVLETSGAIRIWVVDASITIPTGIYDFSLPDREIELSAANAQGLCQILFAAGAQFANGPRVMRGMTISANGSNAVLKVDSSLRIVATDTTFSGGGAHPVIDVQAGATLDLALDGALGAITNGGGTDTVVELGSGGGGTLVVQAVSSGDYTVGQNTVGGAGGGAGTLVLLTSPSASFSQVQTGLTTPPTYAQLSVATGVKFVPSTPADWAIVPTEVGGALDELAAKAAVQFTPFVQQTVLAANKSTTNTTNPPSVDKLLTHNITLPTGYAKMLIRAMAHCTGANNERIYLAIYVDGVIKARDWIFTDVTSTDGESNFEVLVTGLAAGAHVIDLYWSVTVAGNAVCNPLATPDTYRCTITVEAFA